jgi:hydrogenase expression/formation protein HypE
MRHLWRTQPAMCEPNPWRSGLDVDEIARFCKVAMITEAAPLPIRRETQSAFDLLCPGPVYLANEGQLVALVANDAKDVMRQHPRGKDGGCHRRGPASPMAGR